MNTTAKALPYRPIGLLAGIGAGLLAGKLVDRAWTTLTGRDDAPDAWERDRGWTEILLAAAIEGAIFAVTRTAVERASAVGVERATGTWPGA
ncbi:DUF4235 domain-containing protein [Embleya sp. NPDC005575]|uniref:DUF4235 domain-containing protein n=1 Tax=Embleya sp. NPDC005575 TaxID=3156892 RepID=UPI0033B7F39B